MKTIAELLAIVDPDADASSDEELRTSFRENGWLEHRPAIVDENGLVIAGNRRLRVAALDNISPLKKVVTFGTGPAADAARMKMALADNSGTSNRLAAQRQRYVAHLDEQGMTQKAMAAALGVSQRTISEDLRNLEVASKLNHARTSTNPKGAGRPRKAPKPKVPPEDEQTIATMVLDMGKTDKDAQQATGWSSTVVRTAVAKEKGRREAEPQVNPATLSPSAQEKLAAAKRQQDRLLQRSYHQAVRQAVSAEVQQTLSGLISMRYKELHAKYDRVLNRRRGQGLMSPAEYRLVLSCLHPDSRGATSERKIAEAFGIIQKHKLSLVSESVEPTPTPHDLPKTAAEWMEAKRKATEARRAKRNGAAVVSR